MGEFYEVDGARPMLLEYWVRAFLGRVRCAQGRLACVGCAVRTIGKREPGAHGAPYEAQAKKDRAAVAHCPALCNGAYQLSTAPTAKVSVSSFRPLPAAASISYWLYSATSLRLSLMVRK